MSEEWRFSSTSDGQEGRGAVLQYGDPTRRRQRAAIGENHRASQRGFHLRLERFCAATDVPAEAALSPGFAPRGRVPDFLRLPP